MSRGKASGHSISEKDVPVILGMAARGDRDHDIAAWFGVNQARIAEAKDGKWGIPAAASEGDLPPSGAPGPKGRLLLEAVEIALGAAESLDEVRSFLRDAIEEYHRNDD